MNKYSEQQVRDTFHHFEDDILAVLKKDDAGRLNFDERVLFNSSRYDCLLAIKDIHLDANGELVMVGAFRSGTPVIEKGAIVPELEVPLKECFEDMMKIFEIDNTRFMQLVSKTRKAVIKKYLVEPLRKLGGRGFLVGVDRRRLSFSEYGFPELKLGNAKVSSMEADKDFFDIKFHDDISGSDLAHSSFTLEQIQSCGRSLNDIEQMYINAQTVFSDERKKMEPQSMSFTETDLAMLDKKTKDIFLESDFHPGIKALVVKNLSWERPVLSVKDKEYEDISDEEYERLKEKHESAKRRSEYIAAHKPAFLKK